MGAKQRLKAAIRAAEHQLSLSGQSARDIIEEVRPHQHAGPDCIFCRSVAEEPRLGDRLNRAERIARSRRLL